MASWARYAASVVVVIISFWWTWTAKFGGSKITDNVIAPYLIDKKNLTYTNTVLHYTMNKKTYTITLLANNGETRTFNWEGEGFFAACRDAMASVVRLHDGRQWELVEAKLLA